MAGISSTILKENFDEDPLLLDSMLEAVCMDETCHIPVHRDKALRIAHEGVNALLSLRRSHPRFSMSEWGWLSEWNIKTLTRKDANKFLCGCILEYQAGKVDVWDNTAYFVEEELGDPENLWSEIARHTRPEWETQFWEYNIHPDPAIHARLWDIAVRMIRFYQGDARKIWDDFEDSPHEVFRRLLLLQVPRSTACLVIGALKDEQFLSGPFDIVGDVVDSRVLGRVLCGISGGLSTYDATRLARIVCPSDPWILDRPLYVVGMSTCGPGPRCRPCVLRGRCTYEAANRLGLPVSKILIRALLNDSRRTEQKTLKKWQIE